MNQGDYLGNLYSVVCDYLWNGSTAVPQIIGLKSVQRHGTKLVKPNNYIRWDNDLAEARFTKKEQVQPGDLPEVEVLMGSIRTQNLDSCRTMHDINFEVRVTSGTWKLTNATQIYQQILSLLATAMHTSECCHWDITQDSSGVSEEPKSTIVEVLQPGDGTIGRDSDVSRNIGGWTFTIRFAVRIQTNVLLQKQVNTGEEP